MTERDRQILEALATHGVMTREHIRALFFRDGTNLSSVQAASRRLKMLTERGFLTRIRLAAPSGSGPFVYLLGKLGQQVVEQTRGQIGIGRTAKVGPGTLFHTLERMGFYVRLKVALEERGGEIIRWLGERDVRYVLKTGSRRTTVSPDAYCGWALGEEEGAFFLEVDRGTESMARIREKLERYMSYYKRRAYVEHLGEDLRPRLVFLVPDSDRAHRVTRWLSANKGKFRQLPTIMVGTMPEALGDPLGSIWWVPGQQGQRPLAD